MQALCDLLNEEYNGTPSPPSSPQPQPPQQQPQQLALTLPSLLSTSTAVANGGLQSLLQQPGKAPQPAPATKLTWPELTVLHHRTPLPQGTVMGVPWPQTVSQQQSLNAAQWRAGAQPKPSTTVQSGPLQTGSRAQSQPGNIHRPQPELSPPQLGLLGARLLPQQQPQAGLASLLLSKGKSGRTPVPWRQGSLQRRSLSQSWTSNQASRPCTKKVLV